MRPILLRISQCGMGQDNGPWEESPRGGCIPAYIDINSEMGMRDCCEQCEVDKLSTWCIAATKLKVSKIRSHVFVNGRPRIHPFDKSGSMNAYCGTLS